MAKRNSVCKGLFDLMQSVLTIDLDTATPSASLAKFAETETRGFPGIVPFVPFVPFPLPFSYSTHLSFI